MQLPSGGGADGTRCAVLPGRTDYRIAIRRIADGGGIRSRCTAFDVGDTCEFRSPQRLPSGLAERDVLS